MYLKLVKTTEVYVSPTPQLGLEAEVGANALCEI